MNKQTKVAKLKVNKSTNIVKDVADKYIDGKRETNVDKQTNVAKSMVDKSTNIMKDVADKYITGQADKCSKLTGR
jgi:hypothetical protein